MPKGEEKKGRDKKKPKQDKAGKSQSEYAKSMAGKSTAPAFGAKK